MASKKFEDLEIWKDARTLCKKIHVGSENSTLCKDLSIRDQIYRSSGSVMDNIAEGFERNGKKEFIQFLYIAKGSLGETRSQVYRAFDFSHFSKEFTEELINECMILSARIMNFIKYMAQTDIDGYKKMQM